VVAQSGEPAPATRQNADPAITATSVVGEVSIIIPPIRQMTVKTEAGSKVAVGISDKTVFLRIPPGERTLDKATRIPIVDIEAGDKVYARGKVADDKSSIAALQVIVMSKADIASKQAREREEWQRRSIAGIVTAVNPEKKELTLRVRTVDGARMV